MYFVCEIVCSGLAELLHCDKSLNWLVWLSNRHKKVMKTKAFLTKIYFLTQSKWSSSDMERYGLCLPSESNGKNRRTLLSSNLSAWCVDLMRGHLLHFVLPLFWKSANILGPTTYRAKAILCFFLIHIPALMMVDFLLVSCGPFLPAKRPTHFRLFCLIFLQIRVLSDNTLSQIHFVLLITRFLNR